MARKRRTGADIGQTGKCVWCPQLIPPPEPDKP
jgi:hypothetical protein